MSLRLVLPLLAIFGLALVPIAPTAAEEPTLESAKKDAHTIRIIRPKGAYADHPTAMSFDPMSLLMGGGGPQKSFPALCQRLLELADDEEIDTFLFDLSSPFSMDQASPRTYFWRWGMTARTPPLGFSISPWYLGITWICIWGMDCPA